jgi:hypothetical protein
MKASWNPMAYITLVHGVLAQDVRLGLSLLPILLGLSAEERSVAHPVCICNRLVRSRYIVLASDRLLAERCAEPGICITVRYSISGHISRVQE